jgi:putative transcriptional regulator
VVKLDGDKLIESLHQALKHAQGKVTCKMTVMPQRLKPFSPSEIKEIRESLQLSQALFAAYLNVPAVTAISWEKGRRMPTGAALKLLTLAKHHPEVLLEP